MTNNEENNQPGRDTHSNNNEVLNIQPISAILNAGNQSIEEALAGNQGVKFQALDFGITEKNYNSQLDTIMKGLWMEGHLGDIISTIEQVENTLKEYKNDKIWYRIFVPPFWIVREVRQKLQANSVTKDFWKYLYISWKLSLSNLIFLLSVGWFFISILVSLSTVTSALSIWNIVAIIVNIILFCLWIYFVQLNVFENTVNNIAFTQIHNTICKVFQQSYQKQIDFINKTIDLSTQHKEAWINLEADRQKIPQKIAGLQIQSIEEYARMRKDFQDKLNIAEFQEYENVYREKLTLDYQSDIMDLARTVSIHKATTEAEVQKIKNQVDIQYQNEIKDKESLRLVAQSIAENMGRTLVEQAKTLAKDSEEIKRIEYQRKLVNGIREELQSSGINAMSSERLQETIEQMMNMQNNPRNTKTK